MRLKSANYKLLRLLHLDQKDHLISLNRVKNVVFKVYLYMQLFHVIILLLVAFLSDDNKLIFINAAIYSFLINIIFLLSNNESKRTYIVYVVVNLLVLLISNLIIGESSFLGLSISIYTYCILALILVDITFMLYTTAIGSIALLLDIILEYFFFQEVAIIDISLYEMNLVRILLYGHLLFYILVTILIYFYLDKIRIRKIEKLLTNRTKLLDYLKSLNIKLSSYAFYHSHELRAPVSRALGLNNLLLNIYSIDDVEIKELIKLLNQSVYEIDTIIRKMNNDLEDIEHEKMLSNRSID